MSWDTQCIQQGIKWLTKVPNCTVKTYIGTPKNNKKPDTAILYLSDVFGFFPNNELLVDEFANNGYLTIFPDLFNGTQIGPDDLNNGNVNIMEWLGAHQPDVIDPVVAKTIKYMRETLGVKRIAAVGYCFGARVCSNFPSLPSLIQGVPV